MNCIGACHAFILFTHLASVQSGISNMGRKKKLTLQRVGEYVCLRWDHLARSNKGSLGGRSIKIAVRPPLGWWCHGICKGQDQIQAASTSCCNPHFQNSCDWICPATRERWDAQVCGGMGLGNTLRMKFSKMGLKTIWNFEDWRP